MDDYHQTSFADLAAGTPEEVGYIASGQPGTPGFIGPNDGSTALESQNGQTFVNLFSGVGAYVGSGGGATEPACTFFGYYDTY